ncbi:aminotransferase-like [Striga asiatica]|uniref:Aminotransferase-like n=1 Tax=Striga asiatica TaxID=4170 RepID=A0A5A7P115_STRAF|nr:aminotransferase-like [Striga asiatica]
MRIPGGFQLERLVELLEEDREPAKAYVTSERNQRRPTQALPCDHKAIAADSVTAADSSRTSAPHWEWGQGLALALTPFVLENIDSSQGSGRPSYKAKDCLTVFCLHQLPNLCFIPLVGVSVGKILDPKVAIAGGIFELRASASQARDPIVILKFNSGTISNNPPEVLNYCPSQLEPTLCEDIVDLSALSQC